MSCRVLCRVSDAGLSQQQLEEKAKEIWQWLYRLESEKYDLEQRNKRQRDDLTELAERARQISKGGYVRPLLHW